MNNPFHSKLATFMEEMISFKESLGYSRNTYDAYFRQFDRYCLEKYPNESAINAEMVLNWACLRPDEHPNGLRRRVIAIRELSKYMNAVGYNAYIYPSEFLSKTERYVPYVFNDRELQMFFSIADVYPPCRQSPFSGYIVPVIYRLIYTCGLRPGEVRNLKCVDINLETGRIYIRESKAYKDRIIMMSNDMLRLCIRYTEIMEKLLPERGYFFPNKAGGQFHKQTLEIYFNKCCEKAGLTSIGKRIRVYDLRHNYATRIMMQWLEEGKNLYAILPYLSTFMGHYDFSQTAYYIHLLPERLIHSDTIDWKRFSSLIPEVQQ